METIKTSGLRSLIAWSGLIVTMALFASVTQNVGGLLNYKSLVFILAAIITTGLLSLTFLVVRCGWEEKSRMMYAMACCLLAVTALFSQMVYKVITQ